MALYGSLWLPLWLSLALTATLWHTLALSGSLLLSNFGYTALDRLTGPLLCSYRRCHDDALYPALQTRQDHLLRPDQPDHLFWLIKRIIKKINAEFAVFTLSCFKKDFINIPNALPDPQIHPLLRFLETRAAAKLEAILQFLLKVFWDHCDISFLTTFQNSCHFQPLLFCVCSRYSWRFRQTWILTHLRGVQLFSVHNLASV